jgi:proteasome component ECM29
MHIARWADQTQQIAMREAKRQHAEYRQHSMKALARIAAAREDIDMSGAVFEVACPLLQASNADGDMMEVAGDDAPKAEVR